MVLNWASAFLFMRSVPLQKSLLIRPLSLEKSLFIRPVSLEKGLFIRLVFISIQIHFYHISEKWLIMQKMLIFVWNTLSCTDVYNEKQDELLFLYIKCRFNEPHEAKIQFCATFHMDTNLTFSLMDMSSPLFILHLCTAHMLCLFCFVTDLITAAVIGYCGRCRLSIQ